MNFPTDRSVSVPIPVLAAMGIPAETEAQLPMSLGPVLDPYFEIGLSSSDEGDGWRLCGSPEGPNTFASQADAMEAWRDLFTTGIWLRDSLSRGSLRLERGVWTAVDQVAHYLLIEQVLDTLLAKHQDFGEVAQVVASWLETEAGRGWFLTPVEPIHKHEEDNIGQLIMDPRTLADRMSCLSCRWISRHHQVWRASKAAVHEQGSVYAPAMLVATKQDRAWLNPALMAVVWGRAMAYALGMPRIPASMIINHRSRPGTLRLLTGWVLRAGWRPEKTTTKIPLMDLPSWYGHGPGSPIPALRRRLLDDIMRIRLAFESPLQVPALTSTGLALKGLQGVSLNVRRQADEL